MIPILASVAMLATGCGSSTSRATSSSTSSSPTSQASGAVTPSTDGGSTTTTLAVLPAGQTADAYKIAWASVGQGWTLAV